MPRTKLLKSKGLDKRSYLPFVLAFAVVGGYAIFRSFAAGITLSNYYPDQNRYQAGYYLNGNSYADPQHPVWSVLWFQSQGGGAFKQFNSAPYDQCHWDLLAWTSVGLTYTKTHDQCGSNNNEVVFSPGITYMPQSWNSTNWMITGSSKTTYYNSGRLVCSGTNSWSSKIIGWEQMAPNVRGLHVQNNQQISWTYGKDPSGCATGYTTKWQENFYLVDSLPIAASTTTDKALKRIVGGNLDNYNKTGHWDYDVWFDAWQKLP